MLARPAITVIVVVLATLATAVIPIPVTAERVELSWRDSGYDLARGYRYSITMDSDCVWTGACALAAVSAGPFRAELRGSTLTIYIDQNREQIDVGPEGSATIYITVDCSGHARVEIAGYGVVGGFAVPQPYRIMEFTETVSAWPQRASSHVYVSAAQAYRCDSGRTETVTPTMPTNSNNDQQLLAGIVGALGTAATIAVVLVLLGLGIIALLIVFKQAKRRRWI